MRSEGIGVTGRVHPTPEDIVLIGCMLFGNHAGRLGTGEALAVVDRLLTSCNVPILNKESLFFVLRVYSSVQMSLLSRQSLYIQASVISRGCRESVLNGRRGSPLLSCQCFI
jgi:hypothetical protein